MADNQSNVIPLGIGYYTVPEAARLLKMPPVNIRRWLGGYRYTKGDDEFVVPPLWTPQLPRQEDHLELGFRDLIELRFVHAFTKAKLSLITIRRCLEFARDCVEDDRPFSTRRFQTDGRTIFLNSALQTGEEELLDLTKRQYVLKQIIERTFKDLDIENDAVTRWRPFKGKNSIVIDPLRAFGQPIATNYGVPTTALADAVEAEGSVNRAAQLFEVPTQVVRDAVQFEKALIAA
ncbi:MAG TPA: hypothetical protein VGD54_20060 [Steroidobacteraceae bacterium]